MKVRVREGKGQMVIFPVFVFTQPCPASTSTLSPLAFPPESLFV